MTYNFRYETAHTTIASLVSKLLAWNVRLPNWYSTAPRGHEPTDFDDAVLQSLREMPSLSSQESLDARKRWTVNWPPQLLTDSRIKLLAPFVMIETHALREASLFDLYYKGVLICNCLQPSCHQSQTSWKLGGRGGLSSGLYWLSPYNWKDKNMLPVWELKGDSRRGAILLHSGNTVADSKGCILCGLQTSSASLAHSRISTAVVWSIINSLVPSVMTYQRSNGFLILRCNHEYS